AIILATIVVFWGGWLSAIAVRPSTTTLIDASICAIYTIPLVLALIVSQRLMLLALVAMSLPLLYAAYMNPTYYFMNDQNVKTYAESREAIVAEHAYVDSLNRPTVLYVPTGTQ